LSDNLTIYNAVRQPPREALKPIQAGRMKGKTDINPMWRLKALTEQFGPCGIGWKYVITKQWLEKGGKDEIAAFANIDLFVKVDGEWSEAIPGTGGSSFVALEKNGLYTSDECFKMALTDAISVSCKALGFAADIYWDSDRSKYDKPQQPKQEQKPQPKPEEKGKEKPVNWGAFWTSCKNIGYTQDQVHAFAKTDSISDWSREMLNQLIADLKKAKEGE
jgi:hypothetical protein